MKHYLKDSIKDVTERIKDMLLGREDQTPPLQNHLQQPVYAFLATRKLDLENSTTDLLLTIHEHLTGRTHQHWLRHN